MTKKDVAKILGVSVEQVQWFIRRKKKSVQSSEHKMKD